MRGSDASAVYDASLDPMVPSSVEYFHCQLITLIIFELILILIDSFFAINCQLNWAFNPLKIVLITNASHKNSKMS
jgi:hypothetical protein